MMYFYPGIAAGYALWGMGKNTGGPSKEYLAWWEQMAKEQGLGQYVPTSQWAGQYGGTFEDWLALQNRAAQGPAGVSAQPWQVPGTSDWLARQYMHDPLTFQLLQNASEIAGKDYTGMFKGAARQAADTQTRSIMNALAARGGGGIGAALAGGAQARAGGELAGLQQGIATQMEAQDPLLNALSYKFNILNQIVGAKLGQTQAHLGYKAAKEGAQSQMWGQIIGGGLGGLGSLLGG